MHWNSGILFWHGNTREVGLWTHMCSSWIEDGCIYSHTNPRVVHFTYVKNLSTSLVSLWNWNMTFAYRDFTSFLNVYKRIIASQWTYAFYKVLVKWSTLPNLYQILANVWPFRGCPIGLKMCMQHNNRTARLFIKMLTQLKMVYVMGEWVVTRLSGIGAFIALQQFMMTSSNRNIFRVTGHLCGEFTVPPVNSPHKGQWRGALMFSLICVWINVWVNNREAGDLRRYRVHYGVIVM